MADTGVPTETNPGEHLMHELPEKLKSGSFLDAWSRERQLENLATTYNVAIETADRELSERLPGFGGTTKIETIRRDIDWGFERGCLDFITHDTVRIVLEEATRIAQEREHDDINVRESVQRMVRGYAAAHIARGIVSEGVAALVEDLTKKFNIPVDSQVGFLSAIRALGRYSDLGRPSSDAISEMLATKGYAWNEQKAQYVRTQA